VRKGRSGSGAEDEEGGGGLGEIALPRSITEEATEADLKRRLNREELINIDKKNPAVKMVGVASEPNPIRRRGTGIWVLLIVVAGAAFLYLADRYHWLDQWLNTGAHGTPSGK
jgi:hypothetical protein